MVLPMIVRRCYGHSRSETKEATTVLATTTRSERAVVALSRQDIHGCGILTFYRLLIFFACLLLGSTAEHLRELPRRPRGLHLAVPTEMMSVDKYVGDRPLASHAVELILEHIPIGQVVDFVDHHVDSSVEALKQVLGRSTIGTVRLGPDHYLVLVIFGCNELAKLYVWAFLLRLLRLSAREFRRQRALTKGPLDLVVTANVFSIDKDIGHRALPRQGEQHALDARAVRFLVDLTNLHVHVGKLRGKQRLGLGAIGTVALGVNHDRMRGDFFFQRGHLSG